MIYLLVFLLAISQLVIYFFNGKKIISVSFLGNMMFLFSAFLYSLYEESFYGEDISGLEVILVLIYILCLFGGELISSRISLKENGVSKKEIKPIKINNLIIILSTLFTIGASLLYFFDVYKYSLFLGNSVGNFFGMAEYVRRDNTYSTPSLISLLNIVVECLVYFFIYVFTTHKLIYKKYKLKYLVPCFGYLIYIFACHSRGNIVRNIAIICIIIFCLINQNNKWTSRGNKKIFSIGITSVVIFFLVFRFLGYRTGTSENLSFTLNLVDYISSGIYGFNKYISEPITQTELFGGNTFKLIYIKLNDFGFNFDTGAQFEPFFTFKGYRSNIYTGFKMLIDDFGYVGCGLFLFLYSFLTTKQFKKIKLRGCSLFDCTILGLLFYPVLMISIGGVWPNVFGITTLYMMAILILVQFALENKFGMKSGKKR